MCLALRLTLLAAPHVDEALKIFVLLVFGVLSLSMMFIAPGRPLHPGLKGAPPDDCHDLKELAPFTRDV